MKLHYDLSKKLYSQTGLGPIAMAIGMSGITLVMSLGGLAVSQYNQMNLMNQKRTEVANELNDNALKLTRKLIATSDFVKNATTKVWTAATPNSNNPLWKFGTAPSGTLGVVNFMSCDPQGINPGNEISSSLTTCNKLSTATTFLRESNGRTLLQMTTELNKQSRTTLTAMLMPPPTVDLKAAAPSGVASDGPITINNGQAVTLIWTTSGADSCNLSPLANTQLNNVGLSSGALNANRTFSLSCTGPGGSATDSVSVTVITAPAPLADLKVAPPSGLASNGPISINSGEKVTLSWTSTNATSCSVTPGGLSGISNAGIQTTALSANTTYTLSCNGVGGAITDSVIVNVSAPQDFGLCNLITAAPATDYSLPPAVPIPTLPAVCTPPSVTGPPILISSAADLQAITKNKSYKLISNITLPSPWTGPALLNVVLDGAGFSITGVTSPVFKGISGSLVQNLVIKSPLIKSATQGIAGALTTTLICSTLDRIKVVGGMVVAPCAGGLAVNERNSVIANSGNSANVCGWGGCPIGGIVAATGWTGPGMPAKSNIVGTTNRGSVTAGQMAGGIVGESASAGDILQLTSVSNTGSVSGAQAAGIIAFGNKTIIVDKAANSGSINGGTMAGGILASQNMGTLTISNSTNSGSVKTKGLSGGIMGQNNNSNTTILGSSNSGSITCQWYCGGIHAHTPYGSTSIDRTQNTGNICRIDGTSTYVGAITGSLSYVTLSNSTGTTGTCP